MHAAVCAIRPITARCVTSSVSAKTACVTTTVTACAPWGGPARRATSLCAVAAVPLVAMVSAFAPVTAQVQIVRCRALWVQTGRCAQAGARATATIMFLRASVSRGGTPLQIVPCVRAVTVLAQCLALASALQARAVVWIQSVTLTEVVWSASTTTWCLPRALSVVMVGGVSTAPSSAVRAITTSRVTR